jgi:hypothetical protein
LIMEKEVRIVVSLMTPRFGKLCATNGNIRLSFLHVKCVTDNKRYSSLSQTAAVTFSGTEQRQRYVAYRDTEMNHSFTIAHKNKQNTQRC